MRTSSVHQWSGSVPLHRRRDRFEHWRGKLRGRLLSWGWVLLWGCLPSSQAWATQALCCLSAAGLRLSLPAGSQGADPVILQWLGQPMSWQPFTVPLPIDALAPMLLAQFPAAIRPALQVEPGLAMLAWFDADTHWLLRLTGARLAQQRWQTTGNLSGWRLGNRANEDLCASATSRQPLLPAASWPPELRCLYGYGAIQSGARHSVAVYVGAAARRDRLLSLMANAGWLPCESGSDARTMRCRAGTRARVDCLAQAAQYACAVTIVEPA